MTDIPKKLDDNICFDSSVITDHNRKINEILTYLQAKEEAIRETNEALCKWKAHIINSEEASKGEEK